MADRGKRAIRLFLIVAAISIEGSAAATDNASSVTWNGIEYGRASVLSGVYFTNFENSKFIECNDQADCKAWASKSGNVVDCQPAACADLESRIKAAVGNHDHWSTFRIKFSGRRSARPSPKRFVGDTETKVLLERVLAFELMETEH